MEFTFGTKSNSTPTIGTGFSTIGGGTNSGGGALGGAKTVGFALPATATATATAADSNKPNGFSFGGTATGTGTKTGTGGSGTTDFGFGATAAAPSSTPAATTPSTGFGATTAAPSSTPAAPTSTSFGFGKPTTLATTGGGFTIGTASATGTSAATTTGFGLGTGSKGFGGTNGALGTTAVSTLPPTLETPYNKLPQPLKTEIDETYELFIKPTREVIGEIKGYLPQSNSGQSDENILQSLNLSLNKASLNATQLTNQQKRLQFLANNLREVSRKDHHDCHSYGQWALQQIKKQYKLSSHSLTQSSLTSDPITSSNVHSLYTLSREVVYGDSSHPPLDFYSHTIERLEMRLEKSIQEIEEIEQQLHLIQGSYFENNYMMSHLNSGQRTRIGMPEIIELLQKQHGIFLQIAYYVAETHELCDSMRDGYLAQLKKSGVRELNPFEAEDKRILAENRLQSRRAMQQIEGMSTPAASGTGAVGMSGVNTTTGFTTGFNTGSGATTSGFGTTTGGFGATGGGFGATAGGFASPSKVGTGFTTAATGSGGFGKTPTTGFGATAGSSPGAFGASKFGTTTAGGGFGAAGGFGSTTGFGFGQTGAAAAAGGFGAAQTPATTGFGAQPSATVGGFGNANSFGNSGGLGSFGTSAGTSGSFGVKQNSGNKKKTGKK